MKKMYYKKYLLSTVILFMSFQAIYSKPVELSQKCNIENFLSREFELKDAIILNCPTIVKKLLSMNQKIDVNDTRDLLFMYTMYTKPHRYEIMRILINHGANLNLIDQKSMLTPLTRAVINSDMQTIQLLLDHDANINMLDGKNNSPLYNSILWGYDNIVEKLLKSGADVNGSGGNIPIINVPNKVILNLLLDNGASIYVFDKYGVTPLMGAAYFGDAEVVQELVRLGLSINIQDNFGFSPLMYAVNNNKIKNVELFIKLGANIYLKTHDGKTALDLAKERGHKEIVKYLESLNERE